MKHRFRMLPICQNGYVLTVTLLLLLMLTVIGIAATRTSIVETIISRNHESMILDFYATDGAITSALEHTDWWLSDDFLKSGTGIASWSGNVDADGDGQDDAVVEIRCIERMPSTISALSLAANDIPADVHKAPTPIGSGYSLRHFYTRKYAVTATGLNSKHRLQSGAWKVFNTYETLTREE